LPRSDIFLPSQCQLLHALHVVDFEYCDIVTGRRREEGGAARFSIEDNSVFITQADYMVVRDYEVARRVQHPTCPSRLRFAFPKGDDLNNAVSNVRGDVSRRRIANQKEEGRDRAQGYHPGDYRGQNEGRPTLLPSPDAGEVAQNPIPRGGPDRRSRGRRRGRSGGDDAKARVANGNLIPTCDSQLADHAIASDKRPVRGSEVFDHHSKIGCRQAQVSPRYARIVDNDIARRVSPHDHGFAKVD
jgi:hypothetical protein